MLISFGISLIPAAGLALSSQPPTSFPDEPLLTALFVRPPQAAVNACVASTDGTFAHDDVVRVAKCLHRKHLVSAQTVVAAEKSGIGAGGNRMVALKAKTTGATWWFPL